MRSKIALAVTEIIIQDLIKHRIRLGDQMFADVAEANPNGNRVFFIPSFDACFEEYWLDWVRNN